MASPHIRVGIQSLMMGFHSSVTSAKEPNMTSMPIAAAVLRRPGADLSIETVHIDSPLPTEVRLRTLAVGLCHSDLHYVNGNLPIDVPAVLGHEVCGEVE